MPGSDSVPWDKLSKGSRAVVLHLVRRLASGATGATHLEYHQGNVKVVEDTDRHAPSDLVDGKAA